MDVNKKITTNKKLYTTIMGNVFTTDNEKSWKNKQTKKQKQKRTNKTSRRERMKDGKF